MKGKFKFVVLWAVIAFYWAFMARMVNGVLLMDEWMVTDIFRPWPEELARYHFLRGAYVIYAGLAVWIFAYRYKSPRKTWPGLGFEYGVLLALFTYIPTYMMNYTVYRLPGLTTAKAAGLFSFGIVLIGLFLAFMYRKNLLASDKADS